MLIEKKLKLGQVLIGSLLHILWISFFMTIVVFAYNYGYIDFSIPWLPVSVIGTAVAFFVGFKNSQAYQRMWEARKIWGGIINESRTWGMMVNSYVSNLFSEENLDTSEINSIKKRLIIRHISWIYAHRSQLLIPTPWEHVSQRGFTRIQMTFLKKMFGEPTSEEELVRTNLKNFLSESEHKQLVKATNTATQIIEYQSRDLAKLREQNLIDDFRHMELENILRMFYTLQGKNERIKKFPFPRQYANMSRHFVYIFIFLLPFAMTPLFFELESWHKWLSIPITVLIAWIYIMMEDVGDYSENPFQGMPADIPMLSLCRTIEIDLREMMGETELPPPIKAKMGILF